MTQTVRIKVFEREKENARGLEQVVNDYIYNGERYGDGIEDVKTEMYSTDDKVGVVVSYKLKELKQ